MIRPSLWRADPHRGEMVQLVRLNLSGFRRFLKADAHLHGRLMALVGPNEAGKSSLLDALEHLNTTDRFDPGDLSHEMEFADDDTILRARFLLEQKDHDAIAHLLGGAEARWFVLAKRRGGQLATALEPALELDLTQRRKVLAAANRLRATTWGSALQAGESNDVGARLDSVLESLDGDDLLLPDDRQEYAALAESLATTESASKSARKFAEKLQALVAVEPTEHPQAEARRILSSRRPLFLKFSQAHRDLQYVYELNGMDLDSPPVALANLAMLAKLNLGQILLAVQAGDYAAPERPIEDANKALADFFENSWTQSGVTVRLSHHETRLHVLISSPVGPYSSIREHSDGLREFVALATFAEVHGYGERDLVLLIDEAETHLHYNAQADLIRVLDLQRAAAAVIYTTHSAGCLPEDLGGSVRVVVRTDDLWSEIQNAFWTRGVGFDPLLLGMGASALVFGAVRKAAIAEGATDLIALPALLREANSLSSLGYQIAPGVAEASTTAIADLELQAAKAAYVVDDDAGGRAHRAKLRAAGIDSTRIFFLGKGTARGYALEDLIRKELFLSYVNEELARSGRAERMKVGDIPNKSRWQAVAKWCKVRNYGEPKKVSIATAIAINARVERPVLSPIGARILRALHRDLSTYLGS
jgi:predicted ATP-dependent endonuclease of OLD family